jgi:hypothetical protein
VGTAREARAFAHPTSDRNRPGYALALRQPLFAQFEEIDKHGVVKQYPLIDQIIQHQFESPPSWPVARFLIVILSRFVCVILFGGRIHGFSPSDNSVILREKTDSSFAESESVRTAVDNRRRST